MRSKRNQATLKITVEVVCYSLRQKQCTFYKPCGLKGCEESCDFYQAGTCVNKSAREEAMKKYEGK